MIFKVALVLGEGLVFGILALAMIVAFKWLRFPDLTPDGSFSLSAAIFVKFAYMGFAPSICLALSILSGAIAGAITAAVNRVVRVPTVVAGLLVASGLYSVTWLVLGKPNQLLKRELTIVGNYSGDIAANRFLLLMVGIVTLTVVLLSVFYSSVLGLRLRGVGENSLLAADIGGSDGAYTFWGLMLANGLVGLSGALFAQRSYSADVNMGIGMTITGIAGMSLGILIAHSQRNPCIVLAAVVLGSVLYKAVIFVALEMGFPPESFRLVSALVLVCTFLVLGDKGGELLKGLKWT